MTLTHAVRSPVDPHRRGFPALGRDDFTAGQYGRRSPRIRLSAIGLGIGLALFAAASAQAAVTNLGNVGQTQLQQDTGDAVQFTCAGFVAAGTQPGTVPLFDTCRAMVHTGNEVNPNNGPTTSSLRISADELAAGLQQIATEEFGATGSMATEIAGNQSTAVIARLADLRAGARGLSVAGFHLPDTTRTLAGGASAYYPSDARGGAAGADGDWGKLGLFINGTYGRGDRDGTDRTDAFDYDNHGFTAGLDYRVSDAVVLGAAVSYHDASSDFDRSATVAGGGVEADNWGGFVYGTYYAGNVYVDGLAGFAKTDYDISRRIVIPSNNPNVAPIDETAKGSPESDDFTLSVGAGYGITHGALSYGPYARLTYYKVEIDAYRESGAESSGLNLSVASQDWKSLTSVLGGQISLSSSKSFGVVVPQARIGWVHEFENSSQLMKATYIDDPLQIVLPANTNKPDRDYLEVGLGVSAVLQNGLQLYVNYDTVLGFEDLTDHLFTAGARMEF